MNDLLHAAADRAGRPPTKVADLNRYQNMYAHGYEAVKSGKVVVVWSQPLKGEGDIAKGGETIAAYEKDVPTEGGYVLMSAGSVKKMSASEFNAALPKAATK